MMKNTRLTALILAAFLMTPAVALAGGGGECSGGLCGTPKTSGGGGGGGCGCGGGSILINNTDEGDTYQYADDYDEDGIEDDMDNCPFVINKGQIDTDADGFGDSCDNCPSSSNISQLDTDADQKGDVCDSDADNDGLSNSQDNCPTVLNMVQEDADKDGKGDACDQDDDGDGVLDLQDNCPLIANPQQKNSDPNVFGDACDRDDDLDNIDNTQDNCPAVPNMDQKDGDGDKIGDLCDPDLDNDGVMNLVDNCPESVNKGQADVDRDGKGDACDSRYCFVVSGDEQNCLDPKTPLRVYSPAARIATGAAARLRLFANRKNVPLRFKWVVQEHPGGSTATVENPRGSVRTSTPYEYHYGFDNVATFTPDMPGEYKIKLIGTLVFADTVNPNFPTTHSYVVTLIADGDAAGGCSVGGGNAGDAAPGLTLLLSLLGLILIRRRG